MLTSHQWMYLMQMMNHSTPKSIRNSCQVILSNSYHSQSSRMIQDSSPKRFLKKYQDNSWAILKDRELYPLKYVMPRRERSELNYQERPVWRVKERELTKLQNSSRSWRNSSSTSAVRWVMNIPMLRISSRTKVFQYSVMTFWQTASNQIDTIIHFIPIQINSNNQWTLATTTQPCKPVEILIHKDTTLKHLWEAKCSILIRNNNNTKANTKSQAISFFHNHNNQDNSTNMLHLKTIAWWMKTTNCAKFAL